MKTRQFLIGFFMALFFAITQAMGATYQIDPSHSQVIFKVKHLGISTVTGYFENFSGTFNYDAENVKASKVSATIKPKSINTGIARRDAHLRSADFFHVEKFPQLNFESVSVQSDGKGNFELIGKLTMHGVTKSVVLNVKEGGQVKDPWGNKRIAWTGTTIINRKDFGLTWNKFLETGGLMVGEEVSIILEIEGIEKNDQLGMNN